MNKPFFYLLPIFSVFVFLVLFLTTRITLSQTVEEKLSSLQDKIKTGKADYYEFFSAGQIFLQKKEYQSAIYNLSWSLVMWPPNDTIGYACCLNAFGVVYFELKEYENAVWFYTQAINAAPGYIQALTNLALLYETKNKKDEACKIYREILIVDKTNKLATEKFRNLCQ